MEEIYEVIVYFPTTMNLLFIIFQNRRVLW